MNQTKKICKFFNSKEGCRFGGNCRFLHVREGTKKGSAKGSVQKKGNNGNNTTRGKSKKRNRKNKNSNTVTTEKVFYKEEKEQEYEIFDEEKSELYRGWVTPLSLIEKCTSEMKKRNDPKEDRLIVDSLYTPYPEKTYMKESSRKRLLKDFAELSKSSLVSICAAPVNNNNLYEWHANLLGPENSEYFGIPIHISISFTEEYPNHPPAVTVLTPIPHSHILGGGHICLDLLETHYGEEFSGWSTAYSLLSILIQLQSFLFYDEDRSGQLSLKRYKNSCKRAMNFQCKVCKHDMKNKSLFLGVIV